MKKQTKKVAAKEKATPKKSSKKVKAKKEVAPQEQPKEEAKPEPQSTVDAPTPLSMEDKRRLEFKYGGRILADDLTGTRAEVINKVAQKIAETTPEELTVMLNDIEFSG